MLSSFSTPQLLRFGARFSRRSARLPTAARPCAPISRRDVPQSWRLPRPQRDTDDRPTSPLAGPGSHPELHDEYQFANRRACPKQVNRVVLAKDHPIPVYPDNQTILSACRHEQTLSNLGYWLASARGRTVAFLSWHPALADRCTSRQGCLPTMRVRLRGCSSAQRFRAHWRRYGPCGYRHVLQVPARDTESFACALLSWTVQEYDRRCLDALSCRDRREK